MLQEKLNKEAIPFETHKRLYGLPDLFIKPDICIFVDGDYWHCNPNFTGGFPPNPMKRREKDKKVNNVLLSNGYKVLRFWGSEIKSDMDSCFNKIVQVVP